MASGVALASTVVSWRAKGREKNRSGEAGFCMILKNINLGWGFRLPPGLTFHDEGTEARQGQRDAVVASFEKRQLGQ